MKREIISIELLLLSDGNPRLDPSLGEEEAIYNMVKDQGNKLFNLATDIVEYGLNPLETIGAYPSEVYSGFYEVGEGNRRLCALKLLLSPHRIQFLNPNLFSKFETLSKKYSVPKDIEVVVFKDEQSLRHWMEIRHMGEQDGKGLSKWNSVQKARYNRTKNGADKLLDFWDWMIKEKILTNEEISKVTLTNWNRILREKYYPFLKIQFDRYYSVLPKDYDVFKERIRAIQQELAGKSVAIVYDNDKIEEFYNVISNNLYGLGYKEIIAAELNQISIFQDDINDFKSEGHELSEDKIVAIESIEGQNSGNFNIESETNKIVQPISNPQITGKDAFNGCKTIIPRNYPIRSTNMRLNKIINELKQINVDIFPNACGALLRTLFELSAKVYLEKCDGKDHKETQFEPAIKGAANLLIKNGRIDKSQHSSICSDIDNLRLIFNGYMHNTEAYPSSEALKNFFKCHRIFIQECLK